MIDNRDACAQAVRALAQWAAGVRIGDIPAPVLQRAARVLADDLAATIGARDEPEVAEFHRRMLSRAKSAEATVFRGGRARTDRLSAAVANGVAADWLELDEGYRNAPCHAGLYLVPALLAECEAHDVAFGDMLRALAVGYEIVTRVARAWTQRAFVMQAHGRYGALGAAAAVALARNADADVLRSALTGAATLTTVSPRDHLISGALVRNVWPAVGAWSGLMSVDWAECGIGGVDTGLYDVYTTVHGGTARPEVLTVSLGDDWAILDGYTKIHACCQHLHAAVEATLEIRDALGGSFAADAVDEILIESHPSAVQLANPRPATTLGAKFSTPHAVAAALVVGNAGADAFTSATLRDPAIARLRERVHVAPYLPLPAPSNDRPARVRVRLADGREFVGECLSAAGGPDRPFAHDVFVDKITALTAPVYPQFAPVFGDLMQVTHGGAMLAARWPALLDRLCAPPD
jgi:2-methylcitrate dehydratase PrpD